jgi:hypothetical protein
MVNKIKMPYSQHRGQSMLEFSMVLPILMLVIFGLLEVGRAVFMYAAVINASREAVRYATAYGVDESNVLHYQNCAEIRNTAKRVGFLLPLKDDNIVIKYDTGPDPDTGVVPAPFASCDPGESVDTGVEMNCGDRVVVTITYDYHPMVTFVPVEAQTFTSSSARTYLGVVELSADAPECK